MNKAQAFDSWRRDVLPELRLTYERDGTLDRPARRESWNNFVDALIKAGELAESASNWPHPRGVETCKPPEGPVCGHGLCSQNYIDTGDADCIRECDHVVCGSRGLGKCTKPGEGA